MAFAFAQRKLVVTAGAVQRAGVDFSRVGKFKFKAGSGHVFRKDAIIRKLPAVSNRSSNPYRPRPKKAGSCLEEADKLMFRSKLMFVFLTVVLYFAWITP